MLLKKFREHAKTLAFRLTVWYAAIFMLFSLAAFFSVYITVKSQMQNGIDEDLLSETKEFSEIYALKGLDEAKTLMSLEAESEGNTKVFLRLLTFEGKETAASDMTSWKWIGVNKTALETISRAGGNYFETVTTNRPFHVVRTLYSRLDNGLVFQMGLLIDERRHVSHLIRDVFLIALLIFSVFACLAGWIMARRALRGVEKITRTAETISSGKLDNRVIIKGGGSEIEKLAVTFNQMLDRIDRLIRDRKDMSDNIAHDLRSPVARIRAMAEMSFASGSPGEDENSMAVEIIAECDSLLELINTMLDISEVESGAAELASERVDMSWLVSDALDLFLPMVEDKGLIVINEISDECLVKGDTRKLQRLVANILDNAIKYTSAGGKVRISTAKSNGWIHINISDTGCGIPEKDIPGIFERFYRCDASRTSRGFGLGLNLARAIARAHHGEITVSSGKGKGSLFSVHLPSIS